MEEEFRVEWDLGNAVRRGRGMKMRGDKREKRKKQKASKDEVQKVSIPTQSKMPHWGREINLIGKDPKINEYLRHFIFYPFANRFILNPIPSIHPLLAFLSPLLSSTS